MIVASLVVLSLSVASLKRAVALCETQLGVEHPLLARSLAGLAATFAARAEPIAAEGLYRTAVDSLLLPAQARRRRARARAGQ